MKLSSRAFRDLVLFVVAIAGVIYETVVEHIDRPWLFALFASMLGVPLFLRTDEKHPPPGGPDG